MDLAWVAARAQSARHEAPPLAERLFGRLAGGGLRRRRHHPRVLQRERIPGPRYRRGRGAAPRPRDRARRRRQPRGRRCPARSRICPAIACGSHLDSVPQGGNFDGAAGVVAGLAALAQLRAEGFRPRRSIRLLGLRGEESAFFGQAYIGSSALFGKLTPQDLAAPNVNSGRALARLHARCRRGRGPGGAGRGAARPGRRSPAGWSSISSRGRCWSRADLPVAHRDRHPRQRPPPRGGVPGRCRPLRRRAPLAAARQRLRGRRADHAARPALAHLAGARP